MFQAEDGIRDLVRSRGLGDVYKRQALEHQSKYDIRIFVVNDSLVNAFAMPGGILVVNSCLLYTSDAADERSSVDLGGRRIIKKKTYV